MSGKYLLIFFLFMLLAMAAVSDEVSEKPSLSYSMKIDGMTLDQANTVAEMLDKLDLSYSTKIDGMSEELATVIGNKMKQRFDEVLTSNPELQGIGTITKRYYCAVWHGQKKCKPCTNSFTGGALGAGVCNVEHLCILTGCEIYHGECTEKRHWEKCNLR